MGSPMPIALSPIPLKSISHQTALECGLPTKLITLDTLYLYTPYTQSYLADSKGSWTS